ncbi:hypothetical protein [Marinobacterium stanieri]|uniref:hypothetical protein n=1 Tax=Marinobacterium stanieri TaxID=49186 RepID=UPI0002559625|nr:hypothetical protein [Marinobacterium stanieri]
MSNLSIKDIPYQVPQDTKGQLAYLASILRIDKGKAIKSGEPGLNAMISVLVYRHLDRNQRITALRSIRKLSSIPDSPELYRLPNTLTRSESKSLEQALITRTLDTTFVNSQWWGLWALTTEELKSDLDFHSIVNDAGGFLGITFSAMSFKDFLDKAIKSKGINKKGWISLIIWLSFIANKSSLDTAEEEMDRRIIKKQIETNFH